MLLPIALIAGTGLLSRGAAHAQRSSDTYPAVVEAPSVAGGEGLPGEPARTSHFTQVVGLVWRTVALWLLALILMTLAHVLG